MPITYSYTSTTLTASLTIIKKALYYRTFFRKPFVSSSNSRTFAPAIKQTRCSAVGSVPGLGPGCRRFEPCHLDQKRLTISIASLFFVLCANILHPISHANHKKPTQPKAVPPRIDTYQIRISELLLCFTLPNPYIQRIAEHFPIRVTQKYPK